MIKAAQTRTVNAAFGMGPGNKAVIKLDKMAKPEALAKQLMAANIKPAYFGTLEIDSDDASTAKFTMNKAPGGFENRLVVALKGTGISKVEIGTGGDAQAAPGADPTMSAGDASGGAADSSADGAFASAGGGDSAPDAADASGADSGPPDATGAQAAGGDPANASGSQPSGANAAMLTSQLTALVKQMAAVMGNDPSQRAVLVPLAMAAQAGLKSGDLQAVQAAIATLTQALAGAAAPAGQDASAGDATKPIDTPAGQAHAKAGLAWKATYAKLSGDLDKLTAGFTAAFQDHPQAAELQQAFSAKIDSVLGSLDQSLSDKLSELSQAQDAATHQKIVSDAKAILAQYQQTVANSPILAQIDENPIVPLSLQKTLNATLGTLAKVLV